MLGALIGLIITLVILGVIWWAAMKLLALVSLGEPFNTLIHICVVVRQLGNGWRPSICVERETKFEADEMAYHETVEG